MQRDQKRAKTRAELIAAASALIQEEGFAAASLDAIARRAGLTKGAIYSNFADKTELLMAVRADRTPVLRPALELTAPLARQLRLFAEALIENLDSIRAESRFVAEYQLYAQTDKAFGDSLAAGYTQVFDHADAGFAQCPDELLISGRQLMVVLQSTALGLIHQSFMSPAEITPEIIRAAFDAIARGVVKPPSGA